MASRRSPATGKEWQHRRTTVPYPADGMRIGVVADTHSKPHPNTLDLLAAAAPDLIVHAGDIGDLGVLDDLATIAPVHAVRGNIDGHAGGLPDSLRLDLVDADSPDGDDDALVMTVYMTHIAVYGPKLNDATRRHADDEAADLVICGHSHVPLLVRDRGMPVFNPGSCGPKRFQLPILFGLMTLSDAGTGLQHIDCLTGEPWRPPA